jgi:hypothetical protein
LIEGDTTVICKLKRIHIDKDMTEKLEYPAVNLRHPIIIFWFVIFISISAFFICLAFIIPNIWLTCLFSFLSLLTPFTVYYSLTTKIIVDNYQVIKKSIFGVKSLNFSDIKSFGVYKQEGNFARKIKQEEYDENDWFGINFIYVANRKEYSPMSFKQKGSIRFHYFNGLYLNIENKIKACK